MVQLSLVFFSLCLLTTFASPVKRWVVQLENDIRNIGAQITILDNNITAFPSTGPTLVQALVFGVPPLPVPCAHLFPTGYSHGSDERGDRIKHGYY